MKKLNNLVVQQTEVSLKTINQLSYLSLTDIARARNADEPKDVVKNWLRTRQTIEFLGLWEKINNPSFKGVEFDVFRTEAGFTLSPTKWIEKTQAIGIVSKANPFEWLEKK